ncbi:pol-like protein [Apostichopus japonicus]|uniref:Pol-like protein n=1 Tax=Stichopus japonicus TaxID=307972 RepID=A0A2G8JWI0_STIJA|nr:pol-like protein [Apostichopus japonicus]
MLPIGLLLDENFFNTLPSFVPGSAPCVMVGDFNCVPDSGLDRLGASVSASPDDGITELDRLTSAHLLADVWRHMHPCGTVYTWVRPNGEDASRIDRVYAPADLLRGISKTVPHDVNDILGGGITTVELWKALSKMKNGKSPGSDGLPREFYRTFWAIIGPDIRAVFEDAFQNGLLNQSQRLGMITLLPKSGDPLDPLTSVRSPC